MGFFILQPDVKLYILFFLVAETHLNLALNIIYLFLAVLGLPCFVGSSLVVASGGVLLLVVCRLFIALVAAHGSSAQGFQ